ncbi:phage tail tape measure protein [Streptomyces sp. NPDC001054]
MPSVGYATLQIIPSVRGIGDELRRQLVAPAADAGEDAGQAAGGGFGDKLKAGVAVAGVAAGALLVKGLQDALAQGNVTRSLQAQLGATGKDAARYGKVAGQLYSSGVSGSFEDAADAIKSVMQSGIAPPEATNKQLQAIATKASDVANIFGQDLPAVTNAASQAIRTGLVKNSDEAFDLITVGFQSGADKAGDFLDTLNEYGTQFRKAGLDGQTALGLINQGLRGGARDADLVADSIKEFSIRAIDGSTSTAAGFKALGLNADDMAGKFAKGGKTANGVLDLTLDKLRNVKDPVKQSQIAVELFGTQAEDLGQALFKLDPSKAAKGIGNIGGAAKKAGDTIRSGPSHDLTVFSRTLQQGLVNVLGTYAVPALTSFGKVAAGTFGWFKQYGPWLAPVAAGIVGLTVAVNANTIATRTAAVASRAWAAVQAVLNAVLSANPIGLIVVGLVALGTALVVAYKKSDTFRAIVQAAWAGIKTAASAAWTGFLKPMFDGFMTGLREIGTAATWLWTTVLSPTFSVIGTAARILATVIGVILIGPTVVAVKLLGATFSWLWKNAIGPVFGWIKAGASLLWAAVKMQFNGFKAGLQQLGAVFSWLWRTAVSPVFGWIKKGAATLWAGVKVQFGYFQSGLRALGSVVSWLWKNAVSPAWSGIKTVISGVWATGIKPVFTTMKSAVKAVGASFNTAKNAIGTAWGKVSGIAKKPVEFVIDTVYNKGLVGVWNKVAKAFGAPKLETFKGFATGGVLPGYTPGRDVHLAALSGGEAVMRPEWTRAVGPGYVDMMNRAARSGGVSGVQRALNLPAFADGGIFGWAKSAGAALKGVGSAAWNGVKKGASWLKDSVESSARAGVKAVVNPLINQIPGSSTGFGKLVRRVPNAAIDALFGYAKEADKQLPKSLANPPGGGVERWRSYVVKALTANGLSTSSAMVEKVLRQIATESGGNPRAVQGAIGDINNLTGDLAKGLMQTISATFNHYKFPGHGDVFNGYDNLLAALNYAKHRYGPSLSFLGQGHGYANGGRPRSGEVAWVGERGPELVRFKGGEEVYDHRTSLAMAAGIGARGFAKGTLTAAQKKAAREQAAQQRAAQRKEAKRQAAQLSARKEVPGDLTAFTRSVTGSASDISRAAAELTKDLKATGGASKGLISSTSKAATRLESLSKQRDTVSAKIDTAKQAAADQKATAADYLGLGNFTSAGSVDDLLTGMKMQQRLLGADLAKVSELSDRGLSKSLISQLVAMGPNSSMTRLLSGASAAQIKELNTFAKRGSALATSYGQTTTDILYDAGKSAGNGFLSGLLAQKKALQGAMSSLAQSAVKAIKSSGAATLPKAKKKTAVKKTAKPKKYDSGGWLMPGLSTVVNKTGRPEAVLTAGQWDAAQRGMTGGGPSYHYEINARTADFTVADLERVQRVQEARARVGRPR